MLKISLAAYRAIHPDFRGIWTTPSYPELIGRRSAFAASLGLPGPGTRLAIEGIDFEIIAPPKATPRRSRKGR